MALPCGSNTADVCTTLSNPEGRETSAAIVMSTVGFCDHGSTLATGSKSLELFFVHWSRTSLFTLFTLFNQNFCGYRYENVSIAHYALLGIALSSPLCQSSICSAGQDAQAVSYHASRLPLVSLRAIAHAYWPSSRKWDKHDRHHQVMPEQNRNGDKPHVPPRL